MLVKNVLKGLIGSILLFVLTATALSAAPVFSDNFDTDALAVNQTVFNGGWTVTDGSVDVIGDPGFYDFLPSNGRYIDLDGSTSQSGLFSNTVSLTSGQNYELKFDLAGSQRGDSEYVHVTFGNTIGNYTLNSNDGFSSYSLLFNPDVGGVYSLAFQNFGGDNVGALLDNVSVSPVPEPSMMIMMLLGLVGISAYVGKRK